MKPEDTGASHQVRHCCGTKRILVWLWNPNKILKLQFHCASPTLLSNLDVQTPDQVMKFDPYAQLFNG